MERGFASIRAEIERPRPVATNWATIFAAVGLAVVIIGAIGTAYVTPIRGDVVSVAREGGIHREHHDELIQRNAVHIEDLEQKIATLTTEARALAEKFTEVETQFRWGTDVGNVRSRNLDRMLSILWEKTFTAPLPGASLPDAGPNKNGK